jgi:hypothetical protein
MLSMQITNWLYTAQSLIIVIFKVEVGSLIRYTQVDLAEG